MVVLFSFHSFELYLFILFNVLSPHFHLPFQGSCSKPVGRSFKRLKRSKEETGSNQQNVKKNETVMKDGTQFLSPKDANLEDQLLSWMSMDETQFVHCEKLKECDITVDCVDTDETDDDEEDYYHEGSEIPFDIKDWEINGNCKSVNDAKQDIYLDSNTGYLENHSGAENKQTKAKEHGKRQEPKSEVEDRSEKNETKNIELYDGTPNIIASGNEVYKVGFRNVSLQRKPPKLAFCPKEVKGIIESEVLLQKNAQSHTMRKIIVFSCLGIRHGCEEIYELDFNHFSILRKGEPFISPQNPGVSSSRFVDVMFWKYLVFRLIMTLACVLKGIFLTWSLILTPNNAHMHHNQL